MVAEQQNSRVADLSSVTSAHHNRVRAAVAAGISKYRVNQLTGIGRSTIDRILVASGPASAIKSRK